MSNAIIARAIIRSRNDAHATIPAGPARDAALAILDDLEQRLSAIGSTSASPDRNEDTSANRDRRRVAMMAG